MEQTKCIDSVFFRWDHSETPGGQVCVKHHGKLIYSRCFGLANLEHHIPITPTTRFHVASVSKQVTVLSLLLLAEQGKVNLDADIRCYLPEMIHFKEPVTVRNLMNNNSGIRDQWELFALRGIRYTDTITMRDFEETLRLQKTLNFKPGSRFLYSNSNFTMIALIVQRVSGMDLPDFVQKYIFEPLGMDHTSIRRGSWDFIPELALSYSDDGNGTFTPSVLNFALWGATSMNTTASDLLLLLENYHHPTICSQHTIDEMMKRPVLSDGSLSNYAGGLFVHDYHNRPCFEHGGVDAGYRAHIYSFPQDELDIVILSNISNTATALAAQQVADIVLGLEPSPRSSSPHTAQPKEGLYFFTGKEGEAALELMQNGRQWIINRGTPLSDTDDGNWKIGYLPDRLTCTSQGILWDTGTKTIPLERLEQAKSEGNESLLGTYYSEDLNLSVDIHGKNGLLWCKHSRYGSDPLMQINAHRFIYRLDGDSSFIIEWTDEQTFCLDASRCFHIVFRKQKSDTQN